MIAIVTPVEMAAIDAAAPESLDVLIRRAAGAVARAAISMMGGTYGRRVVVVAGSGHNGTDGRIAAGLLARRGVHVTIVESTAASVSVDADLVIDAAFGTGLRRHYAFPMADRSVPTLAVDIPSGVDGLTGAALGSPRAADRTVTFAALKPGLILEPGRSLAGTVDVADIGLDVANASAALVEGIDVADWLPSRTAGTHKWDHAVRVVGGSASMTGAPRLAALAAQRMGAGYVQVAIPGRAGVDHPIEAVGYPLPESGWGAMARADTGRLGAVLLGPGLGPGHTGEVAVALAVDRPLVVDGDALQAEFLSAIADRDAPTILTPHEGEFARLVGAVAADRFEATRALARRAGAVVVSKGPTTIIAGPDGSVLAVANGGPDLATAGTGDVLAGSITALLAQGLDPVRAGAVAAWLHAEAGREASGLVASDLPERMAALVATI